MGCWVQVAVPKSFCSQPEGLNGMSSALMQPLFIVRHCWVDVKEFKLRYHKSETLFVLLVIHIMVASSKFLNSNPAVFETGTPKRRRIWRGPAGDSTSLYLAHVARNRILAGIGRTPSILERRLKRAGRSPLEP